MDAVAFWALGPADFLDFMHESVLKPIFHRVKADVAFGHFADALFDELHKFASVF